MQEPTQGSSEAFMQAQNLTSITKAEEELKFLYKSSMQNIKLIRRDSFPLPKPYPSKIKLH